MTKKIKFTTTLLITSAIVSLSAVPGAYGSSKMREYERQQAEEKARQEAARVTAEKATTATAHGSHVKALADPAHELDDAQALGTAIRAARADGANSLVAAGPAFANNDYAGKLAALGRLADNNVWGGANPPGVNDVATHFPAVVAALGLGSVPNARKKAVIDTFIAEAQKRLVHLPGATIQKDALIHPANTINTTLDPALGAASADGASAATGKNHATLQERIIILHDVERSAIPSDANHRRAIRTALGITHLPAPDQAQFIKRLIALADPLEVLTYAGPGTLTQALIDAKADGGSVVNLLNIGTTPEKIVALKALQAVATGGADDPYKRDVRIALGLKSDAGALAAGSPESAAIIFLNNMLEDRLSTLPNIAAALVGLAGGTPEAKLAAILARLNAATHHGTTGAGLGGPPHAGDINAALTRAGL